MISTSGDRWGAWAERWPRYVGAILLAVAAQCGLGAWLAGGGGTEVSRACLYYLSGAAAVSSVTGLVLCLVPPPVGRSNGHQRQAT
jgi:hypothetical protein